MDAPAPLSRSGPEDWPALPFDDWVAREAHSHEVSSAGFWPGEAAARTGSWDRAALERTLGPGR